jgi:hypothetical protein
MKAEGGGAFAAAELPSELRLSLMSMLGLSWKPRDVEDRPNVSRTVSKGKERIRIQTIKNSTMLQFSFSTYIVSFLQAVWRCLQEDA